MFSGYKSFEIRANGIFSEALGKLTGLALELFLVCKLPETDHREVLLDELKTEELISPSKKAPILLRPKFLFIFLKAFELKGGASE